MACSSFANNTFRRVFLQPLAKNDNSKISGNAIYLKGNEGILSMTALMSSLYAQGRDADVKKAMTDSAYLKELMEEFS